jgi:hypothetical protein
VYIALFHTPSLKIHCKYSFATILTISYNEHLNSLFKIVHVTTFNKSLQALQVLYHMLSIRFSIADRYYRALYEKMLSTALRTSTKQLQFVNLLFKSMKLDTSLVRVKAFLKRLLQVRALTIALTFGDIIIHGARVYLCCAVFGFTGKDFLQSY